MSSEITLYDSTGNPQSLDGDTIQKDFLAIGVGQTWQDMTSQRQPDIEYINDTGRPIQVVLTLMIDNDGYANIVILINDVEMIDATISRSGGFPRGSASFIVPNGTSYKVSVLTSSGNVEVDRWAELR